MAEDTVNPVTGTRLGVVPKQAPKAIKGAQAGQGGFASNEDMAKQAAMGEFLKMHPEWGGLGGAARRPPNFNQMFEEFYSSKKKNLPGTAPPPQMQNLPGPGAGPPSLGQPAGPSPAPGPQASLQDVDTDTLMRILNS